MSEALKAAIAAVEAANPTPDAVAPEKQEVDPPAEQGNEAATVEEVDTADDTEEPEAPATSDGKDAPAQRQNKGVGKRINELTREKYEAIRRAEAAERRAQEMEQQRMPPEPKKPAQSEGKPTLADHDFDQEAYLDALADWRLNQKLSERDTQEQAKQKQHQEQERKAKFQERLQHYEAENPGKWDAAVKAPINFTEPMLEVIASSEVGPHIAGYLSENLDRADEISRMTPYAAAAALGRIEASFSAPKPQTTPVPPKTVTKAPAPPPTVGGGSVVRKDLASMEVADHIEAVRAKSRR